MLLAATAKLQTSIRLRSRSAVPVMLRAQMVTWRSRNLHILLTICTSSGWHAACHLEAVLNPPTWPSPTGRCAMGPAPRISASYGSPARRLGFYCF